MTERSNRYMGLSSEQLIAEKDRLEKSLAKKTSKTKIDGVKAQIRQVEEAIRADIAKAASGVVAPQRETPSQRPPTAPQHTPPLSGRGAMGPVGPELEMTLDAE